MADLLRHTPAGLRVDTATAGLLARGSPPRSTFPAGCGQWHVGSRLAAYSCGGSSGLGRSTAPDSLFALVGTVGSRACVRSTSGASAKCSGRTCRAAARDQRRMPSGVRVSTRLNPVVFMRYRRCRGRQTPRCARCRGATLAPWRIGKPVRGRRCPRNGIGASSTVQVPLGHPGKAIASVPRAAPEPGNQPRAWLVGSRWAIGEAGRP
jgi:hypothetical protein